MIEDYQNVNIYNSNGKLIDDRKLNLNCNNLIIKKGSVKFKDVNIKINECSRFSVEDVKELPDYNLTLVNRKVCGFKCNHIKHKQFIRKKRISNISYFGLDPDEIFFEIANNLRTSTLGIYSNNFNKLDKDFTVGIDPISGKNAIKYIGESPCMFDISYNVLAIILSPLINSPVIILAYTEIINSNGRSIIASQSFYSDIDNLDGVALNIEFSKSFAIVLHKDDLLILHIRSPSVFSRIFYPKPYLQNFGSVIIPLNSISIHST